MRSAVILSALLAAGLVNCAGAFSIRPPPSTAHRRQSIRSVASHASTSTSIGAAASAIATPGATLSAKEASAELLRLLETKAQSTASASDDEINALVRTLIASRSSFDPSTCMDGPLFATVHFIGDTPLWEKIGIGGRTVKGQKYMLGNGDEGTFCNYAEIAGENFYLKAVGNCKSNGPVELESSGKGSDGNLFGALASLFNNDSYRQSTLLPTPYDYSATVTGASIVLFQNLSLDLSIEGTGTVRVLYADQNLRIFLSPTDTNVKKGGGDWEKEGLVVVQVRVDLVYGDWVDRL
ncbi:hypothetical protein ACHAXT_013213 [Thalassiosira profunda]